MEKWRAQELRRESVMRREGKIWKEGRIYMAMLSRGDG